MHHSILAHIKIWLLFHCKITEKFNFILLYILNKLLFFFHLNVKSAHSRLHPVLVSP